MRIKNLFFRISYGFWPEEGYGYMKSRPCSSIRTLEKIHEINVSMGWEMCSDFKFTWNDLAYSYYKRKKL